MVWQAPAVTRQAWFSALAVRPTLAGLVLVPRCDFLVCPWTGDRSTSMSQAAHDCRTERRHRPRGTDLPRGTDPGAGSGRSAAPAPESRPGTTTPPLNSLAASREADC